MIRSMEAVIGHYYQHYKNREFYVVIGFGYFTEADPITECVIYQAQYDTPELGERPIFIRPRALFEGHVTDETGARTQLFTDVTEQVTLDKPAATAE